MCDDEETAALVVDNGSGMCKVRTRKDIERTRNDIEKMGLMQRDQD